MAINPYETAKDLGRPAPAWVKNPDDNLRLQAYGTYADIYHNVKDAFTLVLRTGDDPKSRRYVPGARTIVEANNRYLARRPDFVGTVPSTVTLDDATRKAQMEFLETNLKREQFGAKFASMKRWMLIKGDGVLHISADPNKAEGSRIAIHELQPDNYFEIRDSVDAERVTGVYLVTIVLDDEGDQIAQRIEYRRILNAEDSATYATPVGGVFYRLGFYEVDKWDDRAPYFTDQDLSPVDPPEWAAVPDGVADYITGYALPAEITAIPVYHFRNTREANEPFGYSELQGLETLLAGITQNVTDEDLSVALQGIGVYYTDSGSPRDSQGNPADWEISPGSVVEVEDGKTFGRVQGVSSVQPFTDHVAQLESQARETSGTPDVAVGRVDVATVESGVALAISMGPIIAKNEEKEQGIGDALDQLVYDLLNGWFPAFESQPVTGLVVTVQFADPLPIDRKAILAEITGLVTAGIISKQYAAQVVKDKLGYDIDPAQMSQDVLNEQQAALDATGARLDAAAAGGAPAPVA